MSKVFVDWADRKDHTFLKEHGSKVHETEVLDFEDTEVYMEAGAPREATIGKLLNQGCEVFRAPGQAVADIRGDREKNDKADVFYIRELHEEEPSKFSQLSGREQKEAKFRLLVKVYQSLSDQRQRMKNKNQALEKEYGMEGAFDEAIESLAGKKKNVKEEAVKYLPEQWRDFKDNINGIGPGITIQIASLIRPEDYDSLSSFLYSAGFTDKTWETENGHIKNKRLYGSTKHIRSTVRMAIGRILMAKDGRYYKFYKKIKGNGLDHNQACNRVATFVMKELYKTVTRTSDNNWTLVEDVV